MTIGGNIKQRASFFAAVAFSAGTILAAIEGQMVLCLFLVTMFLISAVGVFTLGLTKSEDPTEATWQDGIK